MGKAARTKKSRPSGPPPAAYVARPFQGLPGESDWVALAEILPAATTRVRLKADIGGPDGPREVLVCTVLPKAWPALRRADGAVLVATQGGGHSGDTSRDLGSAILAALAAQPGTPLTHVPLATSQTPPLQDLIEPEAPVVSVHDGFDFWVEGQDLGEDAQESLARANDTVLPTEAVPGSPAAYWCLIGNRPHLRVVLGDDEDEATNALARLWASGTAGLGDGTRLLGAFRAGGLLIPVWELPAGTAATDLVEPLAAWRERYAAAAVDAPLTAQERRAKAGLLNRQITLR
ncbi:MAG: DUF5926 family protein [Nostocoides sp.]|uniref:DUF5926 family protein n=1 Tax=Nostocoides sp. TaxID=1917966 RepID=UPI003BBE4A9B